MENAICLSFARDFLYPLASRDDGASPRRRFSKSATRLSRRFRGKAITCESWELPTKTASRASGPNSKAIGHQVQADPRDASRLLPDDCVERDRRAHRPEGYAGAPDHR